MLGVVVVSVADMVVVVVDVEVDEGFTIAVKAFAGIVVRVVAGVVVVVGFVVSGVVVVRVTKTTVGVVVEVIVSPTVLVVNSPFSKAFFAFSSQTSAKPLPNSSKPESKLRCPCPTSSQASNGFSVSGSVNSLSTNCIRSLG